MQPEVREDARLRLAYDDGLRVIAQQREDLEKVRGRAVTLVSVAAISTGLFGGFLADKTSGHSSSFDVGMVAFGVLVVSVVLVLAPWKVHFDRDSRKLLTEYVDANHDLNDTLRWSAHYLGEDSAKNQTTLGRMHWIYLVGVLALGASVISLGIGLLTRK